MDKTALLAARSGNTTTVDLPVGPVVVRGLTRKEALTVQGGSEELDIERKLLAIALVDPAMSEAEVSQWQEVALAGELIPVVEAVLELSGMTVDAPKETIKGFRG